MIVSRVGYVTRLITSRCQGCSDYLLCIHFYTYTIHNLTITAATISRPILDFNYSVWRLGSNCVLRRLFLDSLLQVQVQVTLRLTVSQSVSLGIEHPDSLLEDVLPSYMSAAVATQ
jgi:hypothetical protein